MTIPALSDLRGPPIVGRFYMVPTVRYLLHGNTFDWPVIGAIHDDARDLNFPHLHYHFDLRFMSETMLEAIVSWHDELTTIAGVVLVEPEGIAKDSWMMDRYGRLPRRPTLKRRKCRLSEYGYSEGARERISKRNGGDKISERFGGIAEPIRLRDGRVLCPHRKVDLSQFTPDADGIVACPLHGLRVRCAASVDTHPQGGDAVAAPFMSGAVPAKPGDAQ